MVGIFFFSEFKVEWTDTRVHLSPGWVVDLYNTTIPIRVGLVNDYNVVLFMILGSLEGAEWCMWINKNSCPLYNGSNYIKKSLNGENETALNRQWFQGRIQDFKLRGGGGAQLEKLGRAEGGSKNVGVFRVKKHDFTPKNLIFSNFRGTPPPPPLETPLDLLNTGDLQGVILSTTSERSILFSAMYEKEFRKSSYM